MVAAAAGGSARAAGTARSNRVGAPEAQITELDSGIRVVTEAVASVRSVALGLWVRTGSRDETPAQAGVSHFLEHLLFKGTKRYSAIQIAEIFDGLGAAVNAATGKESTNLYARFLDTHTDEAFDLLAEMLLGPTYPEIDSEREVVLEEIAMYEDEPQDKVHDVLDRAVFGGHPLGRRVLGEAEVISSIPVPDIAAYHQARYTGANIVVAAGGQPRSRADRRAQQAPRGAADANGDKSPASSAPQVDGARGRLPAEGHRAVPHLLRRARASTGATSAATRSASSTPSSAARPPPASSVRSARRRAWPTRSARTRSSTSTAA